MVKRNLFLVFTYSFLLQANGQADKRLVQADQYFATGDYFTAAGLYGQFLISSEKIKSSDFPLNAKRNTAGKAGKYGTKLDILYRQAESYRLANYWREAADLYKECFEKNAAKYPVGLYWFAVCQRSLENYVGAEESINRFLNGHATGSNYQQAAEKEKATIQFIKSQLTKPDIILYQVKKIGSDFGTERGIFAPAVSSTNQYIITSTQADSVVVAGINPYRNRMFYASLTNGSFQDKQPVTIEAMDATLNQGTPSLSAEGQFLYFTQWRKEEGKAMSAIYYSTKNKGGWSKPVLLSSVNILGYNSKQPFCSADGDYLFFASDRAGGAGGFDIWYAPIQAGGTTGEPVNAGTVLNTDANEQAPFYHTASATLVFSTDRTPGMGGYDLYAAKGNETQWNAPENLGYPINSSRDDIYFSVQQNSPLFMNALFTSDRGAECCLATYTVIKTPKKKLSKGIVLDCNNNSPLGGVDVVMTDASGKKMKTVTNKDGEYLFELTGNAPIGMISANKEKYKKQSTGITIQRIDETAWHTDTLYTAAICMEKKLVIKVENVVTVYFDFDKSLVKERGISQLDSIYTILTQNPVATLQVSGYTDGLGSEEYNKILSDKRAKACADYLNQKGIDAARISFESFGACCPVEMELINGRDNPDGRSMNRRALINITKE